MSGNDTDFSGAPFRPCPLAAPSLNVDRRADGSIILTSKDPLKAYDRQIGEWVRRWASNRPDKVFLAERDASGDWRRVSYAETRRMCDALSQALLDKGLGPERPLMILSENSVNFGLLALAAMQVGIPVAPISPSYSLASQDHSILKPIFDLLKPGLIYVEDGAKFEKPLNAINDGSFEVAVSRNPPAGFKVSGFDELAAATPTAAVDTAFESVKGSDTAKYLFTSGSTGTPKGVINTHEMLCSNQQASLQALQFLKDYPPTFVEWLPWNHTAAGNMIFNAVLFNGGSYYLDAGKPVPGLFDQTLENLRDIAPTIYFNVPAGFGQLLPHLEQDKAFREHFFQNLNFTWYAGAALTQDLWDRYERVAYQATGQRMVMTSGFGTTESSPTLTFAHWPESGVGNIGIPVPGCEVKLAPVGDKMEIRAKGVFMSPGYYKEPELTAESHDEEGFYCFGDSMILIDPDDPEKGMLFDGRISENFKLSSGTWVSVGTLRTDAIAAAAPAIQDMVICAPDEQYLAVLAWPDLSGCRRLSGLAAEASVAELIGDEKVRAHIAQSLSAHNETAGGSSRRVKRVLLMEEPAQIDAKEITDKGYINQRATRERRADLVAELYADPPSDRVIEID